MTLQEAMVDRVNEGFGHWNNGYEDWLEWCNTLYEPDCHYNIQGKRYTLQEYKDLMRVFMDNFDILLGEMLNMLTKDDFIAIRYRVRVKDKRTGEEYEQMTMEFVQYKDNPEPIGARTYEGWAISDRPIPFS